MRRFLVAEAVPESEARRVWPWLWLLPRQLDRVCLSWVGPKVIPPLSTERGTVIGHPVFIPSSGQMEKICKSLGRMGRVFSPTAYGWMGLLPVPSPVPGLVWRTGRLFALLALLSYFRYTPGSQGKTADLSMLVVGGSSSEVAVACRYLARCVRHLVLACPAENFRNRLAYQILTECGLAMIARARPPEGEWDVCLCLGSFPPAILLPSSGAPLRARPHFPAPLRLPDGRTAVVENEHPVWAECHLACLVPEGCPPLPHELSLRSLLVALDVADRAGLGFSLA